MFKTNVMNRYYCFAGSDKRDVVLRVQNIQSVLAAQPRQLYKVPDKRITTIKSNDPESISVGGVIHPLIHEQYVFFIFIRHKCFQNSLVEALISTGPVSKHMRIYSDS